MSIHRLNVARRLPLAAALCAAVAAVAAVPAHASSHREAPFITTQPKVGGTDFYMFASYEPGRDGYITIVANYQPCRTPTAARTTFRSIPMRSTKSTSTTTGTPGKT